jgi:IS5 family transposase
LRLKRDPQIGFDFNPSNLKITNQYYAKYLEIARILDANPRIIDAVHEHLKTPLDQVHRQKRKRGEKPFKYTSDNVLRILIAQLIEGESLRGIVVRIDDSLFLRSFIGLEYGAMIDFTTLCKLKNAIPPGTWQEINRLLAQYAVQEKLIHGDKLRMDTTAVETNIHWPTDSSLLWDTYRTLGRLIDRVREIDPSAVGDKRLHLRRTKRLYTKISRRASKKGKKTRDTLKPLYKDLIARVEGICTWSLAVAAACRRAKEQGRYGIFEDIKVEALIQQIDQVVKLGRRVLDQADRRVLQRETVPNEEKIFSIFEPHTELLKRGKAGKDIEFGHMIQIQQVEGKFITSYEVFERRPVEHQLLDAALERHEGLFGHLPTQLSADKGYYEDMEAVRTLEDTIDVVAIAKKGTRTAEETAREHDPLFRHAQRFRAGVEGTISFMKRVLRLWRCLNRGWEHFAATVGVTVFAHNLLILARC